MDSNMWGVDIPLFLGWFGLKKNPNITTVYVNKEINVFLVTSLADLVSYKKV